MTAAFAGRFGGFLVESPAGDITRDHLERIPGLNYLGFVPKSRWEQFTYTTDAIPRAAPMHRDRDEYEVVCRRSASRLILGASMRRVANHILDVDSLSVFPLRLRRVPIDTNALVRSLIERPTIYTLSFVHARIPAFGAFLRSASFYGSDIGESSFFRESMNLMTFATCGLRKAATGQEIVRLGASGAISFNLSRATVSEVETTMRFLREEGYLEQSAWTG